MKAIFCVGSSHLWALREGYYQRLRAGRTGIFTAWKDIALSRHFKDQQYVISAAFDDEWAGIMSEVEVSAIFLCFGGGEHAEFANIWPFDLYMPNDARQQAIARNGEVIPFDVMLATYASHISKALPFVQHIRGLTNLSIYHIVPPPPSASEDHVKAYPGEAYRELVDRHGVTPALLRQKVWRLCLIAARQIYGSMGISVIEPPPEALDEWGYLAPQYRVLDPVHANPDYGALVADRLVSIAANHETRKSG